ncbi:hypothetical protein BaRGS_00019221 [Batillaria attramentaria]|uniref:Uncharacterized protein n=1 Tax=Batillaria attramentaria TaxID=370345 RepID=A0ABD0KQQ3_9CAEN
MVTFPPTPVFVRKLLAGTPKSEEFGSTGMRTSDLRPYHCGRTGQPHPLLGTAASAVRPVPMLIFSVQGDDITSPSPLPNPCPPACVCATWLSIFRATPQC